VRWRELDLLYRSSNDLSTLCPRRQRPTSNRLTCHDSTSYSAVRVPVRCLFWCMFDLEFGASAFRIAGPAFTDEAIMDTTLDRKPVQSVFHFRSVVDDPSALDAGSFAEKLYRIGELADKWGLGQATIPKLVKDEPGVIQIRQGRKKRIRPAPFRNPPHGESTPDCRTSLEMLQRIERNTTRL
jgi:hypothetical protein